MTRGLCGPLLDGWMDGGYGSDLGSGRAGWRMAFLRFTCEVQEALGLVLIEQN